MVKRHQYEGNITMPRRKSESLEEFQKKNLEKSRQR